MGGGKKVTIGYRYFFGIHMAIGRGPLDALLEIKVGDRTAWSGAATGNQLLYINQPKLFGGDKGEGGVEGPLQVLMGAPDQPVDSRLAAMLTGVVPAFRGVATLFYDGLVTTLNPYPKPWKMRVRRILQGWDGEAWYPAKAPIPMLPGTSLAICIALDTSGSMGTVTGNGQTRLANAKSAINACLDALASQSIAAGGVVDVRVVAWDDNASSIQRMAANSADIAAVKSWVSGRSAGSGTNFVIGVNSMPAFFASSTAALKVAFFITDGEPNSPANAASAASITHGMPDVAVYGINIDLSNTEYTRLVDTTPGDGVPVVSGDDPSALLNAVLGALGGVIAMNPAHIIYECYTNRDWGRGLDPSRLDLDAFEAAADTLHGEGFGLCIKWARQDTLANFVGAILDHIGAVVFTSRRTGKIVLRLVRDDYDPASLPLFTPNTGLLGIDDSDTGATDKAINEVVVKWRDPRSNEIGQVRAQNLAGIRTHGVISETTEYLGIPTADLAARIAQRDLTAYSSGIKKLKVRLDRRGRVVEPGGVFRISDPARGISNLVLRAGRLEDSGGEIVIAGVQDVFGLPATSYVQPELPNWSPPSSLPVPLVYQRAIELPYRELVRITTPADLGYIGDTNSYLLPLAVKPASLALALGFDTHTRVGLSGAFEERAGGEFVPSATLVGALDYLDTTAAITGASALDEVAIGSAALIGDEIVRVDALDVSTGAITLGRGCADTVPAQHEAGARIWFIEEAADDSDPTVYISGSIVQARLLTRTSSGVLSLDGATTLSVDMAGRHARPYPPAGLLLNGESYPATLEGDVEVAFAHRDRLLQADQLVDTAEASIGPEPGTTYDLEIYDDGADALAFSQTGITGSPVTISAGNLVFRNRLLLWAVRDGLRSYQAARRVFEHGDEPWTPAHLSLAAKIWLDDQSPITEVSGAVSQWNDRSANAWHFVQGTAGYRPVVVASALNGRRITRFDGVNDRMGNDSAGARGIMTDVGAAWVLLVGMTRSVNSVNGFQRVLTVGTNSSGDVTRLGVWSGADTGLTDTVIGGRRLDADSLSRTFSPSPPGYGVWQTQILAWNYAAGERWIRQDGVITIVETGFSTGNTSNTVSGRPVTVGSTANSGPDQFWAGDLACLLIGSGSLPTGDELDQLEGWAAWRWGLVPQLPLAHPYKLAQPLVSSAAYRYATQSAIASAATSHAVSMPFTVAVGDLLLAHIVTAGDSSVTTPAGWTLINSAAAGSDVRSSWYYKIAVGTEGRTTVDFVTGAAVQASAQVHRIKVGGFDPLVAPEVSIASGSSAEPNSPVLAPSWGAAATLWLSTYGAVGAQYPAAQPGGTWVGYTESAIGGAVSMASTRFELAVAALNPAWFTLASGAAWVATTVAIKPA